MEAAENSGEVFKNILFVASGAVVRLRAPQAPAVAARGASRVCTRTTADEAPTALASAALVKGTYETVLLGMR